MKKDFDMWNKLIDAKRLINQIGFINSYKLKKIKKAIQKMIE